MPRGGPPHPLSPVALAALTLGVLVTACGTDLPMDGDPDSGVVEPAATAVALAGPDLLVLEGARVQLDGHASRAFDGEVTLSWSQIEGPQVLLTNPTGPAPAFVAPLGPDTLLRFRLRAEGPSLTAFDEVSVRVRSEPGPLPVYAEVPPDATGVPGGDVSFTVAARGERGAEVTWSARPLCEGDPPLTVEGATVQIHLPETLPCAVQIEGATADGRRVGPAVRVYWPEGSVRPAPSGITAPSFGVDPGETVNLEFDLPLEATTEVFRFWDASGTGAAFSSTRLLGATAFPAPARPGRLLIAGERRLGSVSGGVTYLSLDVSAGTGGNRAPEVNAGPDRVVLPGGLFTLAPSASDIDGDPLEILIAQVLGPAAVKDEVTPHLYRAPEIESVLLFHVQGFDGTVLSAPASVRVLVDDATTNEAPVLTLETPRYVSPALPFTIDARSVTDDSGYIERWVLAQDGDDPVQILEGPVEVTVRDDAAFTLTAGAHGDAYHLQVSAFDAAGASTSAFVEVIVEEAGPWVDPARGNDETGDGTLVSPFASLSGALPVAIRHRFAELHLATGVHLPFAATLPPGLSLRGGFLWTGEAYAEGGTGTELPVPEGGLLLQSAGLEHLTVRLQGAQATLRIEGLCADVGALSPCLLDDVEVLSTSLQQGPLLEVGAGAVLTVRGSSVTAGASQDLLQSAVVVEEGAVLRLEDTVVTGGAGEDRTGVSCHGAAVDVLGGAVVGASAATTAVGIDAEGCDLQLVGARVTGGAADATAFALRTTATTLRVEADVTLIGLEMGAASDVTAVSVGETDGAVGIFGTVLTAEDEDLLPLSAHAVVIMAPRAELDGAVVIARGSERGVAVRGLGDELVLRNTTLTATALGGEAIALELDGADRPSLHSSSLVATGGVARGVALASTPLTELVGRDVVIAVDGSIDATALALGSSTGVVLDRVDASVYGGDGVTPTRGVTFGSGVLADSEVRVTGQGEVLGLVVAQAPDGALLERVTLMVESLGGPATGLRAAAPSSVHSSFVRARGPAAVVGLEARAPLVVRHLTVSSQGTGVTISAASASLDGANSLFIGSPGILRLTGAGLLTALRASVFDGVAVIDDTSVIDEITELDAICSLCAFTSTAGVIDDRGRITADAEDLIDRADPAFADLLDIDEEPRPAGALPDVGCDELVVAP